MFCKKDVWRILIIVNVEFYIFEDFNLIDYIINVWY